VSDRRRPSQPLARHRASLRAELVRLGLRLAFKRSSTQADVAAVRRRLAMFGYLVPKPPRDTQVSRLDLDGVPAVQVATPKSRADRHLLYLHGGGHMSGSPGIYRDFIWRLANATSARVTILDHRLAPEHPFPAALDDAVTAYRRLLSDGIDPRRTVIAGESSGGGLTLSTLMRVRDEGVPLPAGAVALSPWTDLALTGASLRTNARADPMIRSDEAPRLAALYLAGADPRLPYASPLYGDPTDLPPMLIQVGSDEVLLDDSVRMAERLRDVGCQVEIEVWPRMPHAWQLWARVIPEANAAIARIGAFVDGRCPP
jgi:monoterpene epsilon-lactone hydrolase